MDSVREPERLGRTALPDGRQLAFAEWGPADGTPVLFCPGAGTSRLLGFGADVVGELGVRLVSVDRPGLGASDPAPGRTLLDWPQDVRALGLDRPAVVGNSQGAPFALACAAAGVARAVAIVSGTDELAHPAFDARHDEHLRAVLNAPDEAFAGMTAEQLLGMVTEMSAEADRAYYAQPAFAALYRRAVHDGFAQGSAGYARDTALAMARWPFDIERIDVPVDLWYGTLDTSPVHSPDFGATLARRLPRARRHVFEDAGGALLWTYSRPILESLLAL